ncbi:hypothetical protein [Streptomyces apocyni]|uniref:hypothetical protein n=1 Tax=Streptomyces apocyni TaxID=2654677 RepID=UPI0012EA532A
MQPDAEVALVARGDGQDDDLHAQWAEALGAERLRALESDLRAVVPAEAFRLDAEGWLGT